ARRYAAFRPHGGIAATDTATVDLATGRGNARARRGRTARARMKMPLLEAKGLTLQLPDRAAKPVFGRPPLITLFRDVDLRMESGESVGIVGESGSGKTSLARTLLRLYEPSA